tara:strand:- start:498 stop:725 length:228 start_codon:yes stop_codon:yes gene_type:complete
MRGQLIIGQALHYGLKALRAVEPEVMQEKSNIADMQLLMEELFPMGMVLIEPSDWGIAADGIKVLYDKLEGVTDE